MRTDTTQIHQLDYFLNEWKRKQQTRVAPGKTVNCTFAGPWPKKEIITTAYNITVPRPATTLQRIFIGCYELQDTREFTVNNPQSNQFVLNVYSNYYLDGQLRQIKFLFKNNRILYTRQKANGQFAKDNSCRAQKIN